MSCQRDQDVLPQAQTAGASKSRGLTRRSTWRTLTREASRWSILLPADTKHHHIACQDRPGVLSRARAFDAVKAIQFPRRLLRDGAVLLRRAEGIEDEVDQERDDLQVQLFLEYLRLQVPPSRSPLSRLTSWPCTSCDVTHPDVITTSPAPCRLHLPQRSCMH